MAPEAEKLTKQQIFKKNLKKSKFYQKLPKFVTSKKLKNYSMANKNLSVNYYQTPEDVFWPQGLERPEKRKKSKDCKNLFCQKMPKFVMLKC